MTTLTLRISSSLNQKLNFALMSMDPTRRFPVPHYETECIANIQDILVLAAEEMQAAVRSSSIERVRVLGRSFCKKIMPEAVIAQLENCPEKFLYLDLEEALICFPWELLTLPSGILLSEQFFIGRHLRLPGQKSNLNSQVLTAPTIIANPGVDLASAAREGKELRRIFSQFGVAATYLSGHVAKNEVLATIERASLFHYTGHSTADTLVLGKDSLSSTDLLNCSHMPFLVFLNSCSPASINGWKVNAQNLAKAFIKGGTHLLISPVTIVDTELAANFAIKFYEYFLAGMPIGQAIHRAAGSIDDNGIARCNYVFYGNPMYLAIKETPKSRKKRAATIAAGVAAVALCLGLWTAKRWGSAHSDSSDHSQNNRNGNIDASQAESPKIKTDSAHEKFQQAIQAATGNGAAKDSMVAKHLYKSAAADPGADSNIVAAYASNLYLTATSKADLYQALSEYERAVSLAGAGSAGNLIIQDRDALRKYLKREESIEKIASNPDNTYSMSELENMKVLADRLTGPCPGTLSGNPRFNPRGDYQLNEDVCALFEKKSQPDPDKSKVLYDKILALQKKSSVPLDPATLIANAQKYENGDGVMQNYNVAAEWYAKAAAAGDPRGSAHLAKFYRSGMGVKKDSQRALELYKQAVQQAENNPGFLQIYQGELEEYQNRLKSRGQE